MNNIYCEKHKRMGKKGKYTYFCPDCATIESNLRKGRGK